VAVLEGKGVLDVLAAELQRGGAGLERANDLLKFLEHFAAGEQGDLAAFVRAVRMAGDDFGEGLATLQFGEGHGDAGFSLLLALLPGDVLDDVAGVEALRA
jgi:hypothetical protein